VGCGLTQIELSSAVVGEIILYKNGHVQDNGVERARVLGSPQASNFSSVAGDSAGERN